MTFADRKTVSSLWLADAALLLASASATRLDMLKQCGVPVEPLAAQIDERQLEAVQILNGTTQNLVARHLAQAKALDVSSRRPGRLVLGADQTLTCENRTYHKPADKAAARAQLLSLSGCEHELVSAYCLARDGQVLSLGHTIARMHMRKFGPDFIDRYIAIADDSALTSVGCYQIEGLGSQLFAKVQGDNFTILGLPLFPVLAALREHGALAA